MQCAVRLLAALTTMDDLAGGPAREWVLSRGAPRELSPMKLVLTLCHLMSVAGDDGVVNDATGSLPPSRRHRPPTPRPVRHKVRRAEETCDSALRIVE